MENGPEADGIYSQFNACMHRASCRQTMAEHTALLVEIEAIRKDAELLVWVLANPEKAAEELTDASMGDGTARHNLERRMAGILAPQPTWRVDA